MLDTKPAAPEPDPEPEPAADDEDAAAAAFMAQAAAEKAAFDEAAKKEAADIAAREAKAKAALEPLAKAREAARAATCEGWYQTGTMHARRPSRIAPDRSCDDDVPAGASGYCQCGDGQAAKSDCDHASFKCQAMCAARQAHEGRRRARGWRQTGGCSPHGPREAGSDRGCGDEAPAGASGYCECHDGTRARESDCDHGIFTCGEACAVHLGLARPDGCWPEGGEAGLCGAETVISRRSHRRRARRRAAPPLATTTPPFCKSSRAGRAGGQAPDGAPRSPAAGL